MYTKSTYSFSSTNIFNPNSVTDAVLNVPESYSYIILYAVYNLQMMNDMPDLDFIYEDSDKYMTEVSGNGSH